MSEVYHCSPSQGLVEIRPQRSTHQRSWIYACLDPILAATFLGREGGDFTCQVARDTDTGLPYVCERFPGAVDLRYGGKKGSIYVLAAADFQEGKTQWCEEVVADVPVTPLEEWPVQDAKEYLLSLASDGKLVIQHYPARIAGIPEDDSDLVEKAATWADTLGEHTLTQVERYHPGLLDRVLRRMQQKSGAG